MRFLDVIISYSRWVVPDSFLFENCEIYLYMKTKIEITKHPFYLQGGNGCFFHNNVITSRNHMQSYEIIPYTRSLKY